MESPCTSCSPPLRGAELGGSSACLAACFGSCVHKRVATQAHIPSAVAEAPRCAATRPTGSGPLTGRETDPRQHEEARLGWLDRGPLPGPCHPDQTFLPLMADIPNYISSAGSRGALGRQGSLCYGRFATGEDSWACTEFGLCEQPSSPHIMLPPRGSCFATLPLTAYPKFRCIQGILCVRLQHFCACDAVRAQIVPLPLSQPFRPHQTTLKKLQTRLDTLLPSESVHEITANNPLAVAPRPESTSPSRSGRSITLVGVTLSKESGLGFSIGAPLAPEPDRPAMAAALGGLPTRNACPAQSRAFSVKLSMPPD